MIYAYSEAGLGLTASDPAQLQSALWLDVFQPSPEEAQLLRGLGIDVPSLAEMEEIELSNRLYHADGVDYLTAMIPGQNDRDEQISGPVTFVLSQARLVTLRHHTPRPFQTFPQRAEKSGLGSKTPDRVFLGLVMEIVGRLADHLEGIGHVLDDLARLIYQPTPRGHPPAALQQALAKVGAEGERLGRVRLALLTLGRALNHVEPEIATRAHSKGLEKTIKAELRDISSLEDHANFLDSRLGLASGATLGMIDLSQNTTVKIVSLVSVLFMPPTLIASIYGMNFAVMPELAQPWGYPAAMALMIASGLVTYAVFRWKGWL